MAYEYSTWFAQAVSVTGWSSGTVAAIQGIPPNMTPTLYDQMAGGGTVSADVAMADMSSAPGDDEGWWLWFVVQSIRSGGCEFDVAISDDNFATTLYDSGSSFAFAVSDDRRWFGLRLNDANFASADLSNLDVRFDIHDTASQTNRFYLHAIYLSKSPYTAAQLAALPSDLSGQNFHSFKATHLVSLFGAGNGDSIPVIPDASGQGSHAFCASGTVGTYDSSTEAVDIVGARYVTVREDAWTGNIVYHHRVAFDGSTGDDQVVTSRPGNSSNAHDHWYWQGTSIGDKPVTGKLSAGVWVMMMGDGSPGAHINGSATPSNGVFYRTTWWVNTGGNEKMWIDDASSPDIDAASGENDYQGVSLFRRESDDRDFVGQISELWVVEAVGISEADVIAAADEWTNGGGAEPVELNAELAAESTSATDGELSKELLLSAEAESESNAAQDAGLGVENVLNAEPAPESDTAIDSTLGANKAMSAELAIETDSVADAELSSELSLSAEPIAETADTNDANLTVGSVLAAELVSETATPIEAGLTTEPVLVAEIASEASLTDDALLEAEAGAVNAELVVESTATEDGSLSSELALASEIALEAAETFDAALELQALTEITAQPAAETDTSVEAALFVELVLNAELAVDQTAPVDGLPTIELVLEAESVAENATTLDATLVLSVPAELLAELANELAESFDALMSTELFVNADLVGETSLAADSALVVEVFLSGDEVLETATTVDAIVVVEVFLSAEDASEATATAEALIGPPGVEPPDLLRRVGWGRTGRSSLLQGNRHLVDWRDG